MCSNPRAIKPKSFIRAGLSLLTFLVLLGSSAGEALTVEVGIFLYRPTQAQTLGKPAELFAQALRASPSKSLGQLGSSLAATEPIFELFTAEREIEARATVPAKFEEEQLCRLTLLRRDEMLPPVTRFDLKAEAKILEVQGKNVVLSLNGTVRWSPEVISRIPWGVKSSAGALLTEFKEANSLEARPLLQQLFADSPQDGAVFVFPLVREVSLSSTKTLRPGESIILTDVHSYGPDHPEALIVCGRVRVRP